VEDIEMVRIDVRDVDTNWFEDVVAYLDRGLDLYYLPRESAERLGEFDEETGNYWLIDGRVEAISSDIEFGGTAVPAWEISVTQLLTRPARSR
jgi:hypothetical protein